MDQNESLEVKSESAIDNDLRSRCSFWASEYYRYGTFGDLLVSTLYALQQENPNDVFMTASQRETLEKNAEDAFSKAPCFDFIRQAQSEQRVKLSMLFPQLCKTFYWDRFRSSALKNGWTVPALEQNAVIDKIVWGTFDIFMYSVITLFLFGVMLIVGIHNPVGGYTIYVEYFGLGIVALYALFWVFATVVELFLGLNPFPHNIETIEQARRLIIQNNIARGAENLKLKDFLEPLNERQTAVAEELKQTIAQYLNIDIDEISFDAPLNPKG